MAKTGNTECRDKFQHCRDKTQDIGAEEMSQQLDPCRKKHLEEYLRKQHRLCRDISKLCSYIVKE